jgi:hypothetical protein
VGPKADDEDATVFLIYFVDESMLDVDPPRIRTAQFTLKGFIGWGILKRIFSQNT